MAEHQREFQDRDKFDSAQKSTVIFIGDSVTANSDIITGRTNVY